MNRLNFAVALVESKAQQFFKKIAAKRLAKKDGDAGTIASLILIVIVVGLLITVKTSATNWVSTLIGYFNSALSNFTLS